MEKTTEPTSYGFIMHHLDAYSFIWIHILPDIYEVYDSSYDVITYH